MHVLDLLQSDSLGLTLLWGEEPLLGQDISGVTATDLEDPGRFLGPGELVLSGLVWWAEGDEAKADRFVAALAEAGATALLAGEETHGRVPDELVAACRAHRVPIAAVPATTSFRAVTEAVYLRQWGDLSRRPTRNRAFALPENVRGELSRLIEGGVGPAELLDRACAHLGRVACYLLTASGRTVARTPSAPVLSARQAASAPARGGVWLRIEAESSPYDAWQLHLPDPDAAPPRVLHEIAEILHHARCDSDRDAFAFAHRDGLETMRVPGQRGLVAMDIAAAGKRWAKPEATRQFLTAYAALLRRTRLTGQRV
ncbi:PucR family transcriptional regulator ligand-binding domain-containing protein [Streptomyces antarcticus]|uniref:PucR family transcriptional regulator ligand-binding domain-containing protein n=1 Tax=Streptomyces antarcticus TaxID=2996458 RepID=UPI002D1E3F67|nr:PucR family transcriptional regulator ligand-binding domain-containing protein [Streptomyces sp. H34-AA3]